MVRTPEAREFPAGRVGRVGTYASWVSWLDAFRRGEEPSAAGLDPVDARLGPYVEARLLARVDTAVTDRVRQWRAALAEAVMARPPVDAARVAELLRDADRRLQPLVRLAASPLLPAAVAATLGAALDGVREGGRAAVDEARRRLLEEPAGSGRGAAPAGPPQDGGAHAERGEDRHRQDGQQHRGADPPVLAEERHR